MAPLRTALSESVFKAVAPTLDEMYCALCSEALTTRTQSLTHFTSLYALFLRGLSNYVGLHLLLRATKYMSRACEIISC